MCTGLGVRMSDVGLGSFHNSLSVNLPLSVLGWRRENKGEGRLLSNELGRTSGVTIGDWSSSVDECYY